jgi:hypothetical protein
MARREVAPVPREGWGRGWERGTCCNMNISRKCKKLGVVVQHAQKCPQVDMQLCSRWQAAVAAAAIIENQSSPPGCMRQRPHHPQTAPSWTLHGECGRRQMKGSGSEAAGWEAANAEAAAWEVAGPEGAVI